MPRYLALLGASVIALWLTSHAQAADPEDEIRTACTDLVLDYAYYRDRYDADAVADLFTQDAVLEVFADTFVGRAAIHERLAAVKNPPTIRHLMSTIRIFLLTPQNPSELVERARGVSYVTVYSAPPGDLPANTAQFLGMGEYHDEFVRTKAGWKIARRTFVPVFSPQDGP